MTDEILGQPSTVVEQPTEKMLSQSEVNDLVGRVKQEAAVKAVEQYKRQQPAPEAQKSGLNESDYRRMAAEEAQRLRDEWIKEAQTKSETESAQRIVKNFYDKVQAGKGKYEDFDNVTGDMNLSAFPNVVQLLADHIDNSGDVLYELGKNRLKLVQLEQLANLSPRDAIVEAQRLAKSIKSNEEVQGYKVPNSPLSQQRPSNVGTDSGGALSMKDLKAKYKV